MAITPRYLPCVQMAQSLINIS